MMLVNKYVVGTVITLFIGTEMPEQAVDPNQAPQNAASDQSHQCLPLIQ